MSLKLLVVDDEAPVVEVLKAFIGPTGNEVVCVTEGLAAAEWVEREKFDGIILDARMPDLDGFELTRRTRASYLNSKTPVVMLTGDHAAETMRQGFKAGATFFLGKPVTQDRVQNMVNALRGPAYMERRRSARLLLRTRVDCAGGEKQSKKFVGESVNIGEGGMLLQTSTGVALREEFNMQFQLPSSDRNLRMKGRVVRQESADRFAVEFIDSSIRDREAIRDYIIDRLQG